MTTALPRPTGCVACARRSTLDESVGAVASTVFYEENPLVLNGAGGTVNRQGWAADLAMNQSYEDGLDPYGGAVPDGLRDGDPGTRARAASEV